MKHEYVSPELLFIRVQAQDILTASNEIEVGAGGTDTGGLGGDGLFA